MKLTVTSTVNNHVTGEKICIQANFIRFWVADSTVISEGEEEQTVSPTVRISAWKHLSDHVRKRPKQNREVSMSRVWS